MNEPIDYSFTRYLASKKSVDDRALNKDVWQRLADRVFSSAPGSCLKIVEIGAGIGTMVERFLEWGLCEYAEYTGIDSQDENISAIPNRLEVWARRVGGDLQFQSDGSLSVQYRGRQILVELIKADLFEFMDMDPDRKWDLLVSHSFLDLVDLSTALPRILQLCRPGGWAYLTLNFDGVTTFKPQIDPRLDGQIEALYHQTMDDRVIKGKSSGDCRTGRHLFEHLQFSGCKILASGASDWVVFPGQDGYSDDEAYFLHYIIDTIYQSLKAHAGIDPLAFQQWISSRHAQIENCELVYITHQLDFLVQVDHSSLMRSTKPSLPEVK